MLDNCYELGATIDSEMIISLITAFACIRNMRRLIYTRWKGRGSQRLSVVVQVCTAKVESAEGDRCESTSAVLVKVSDVTRPSASHG